MRDFLRRLKYYGLGFTVGLIFVVFFMRNRSCSWSPENRVKTAIFERILLLSEENQKELKKLNLSEGELITSIKNGDIDFNKSVKEKFKKVYYFNCKTKNDKSFSCLLSMPEESFISEIIFSEKPAKNIKTTSIGLGKPIYFPKSKDFLYIDSTNILVCEERKNNFNDVNKLFERIKETGYLDFSKSKLNISPKSIHFISFKDQSGNIVSSKSIWYKEKIKIISFEFPDSSFCK